MLIQAFQQNGVVLEAPDLAAVKQKERIRILHVDDDSSLREIFKIILLDLDSSFEIDQACCVDEGLSKLAAGTYDVVVSDYEMPLKDGLQFLTELREQKNYIPFILFTGKGREEVAIKALNLGADGYHNKQGSPETVYGELAYEIRASFGRKNAEKLLKSSREELKAIVFNAPLGIATSNSKMLFLSANEAFCRIIGYSEDELQKRTFRDITYPEDVEVSSECMKELVSGCISFWSKEKRYVRKDGSIIDGKVMVSAIRDSEGKPVLFIAELEDITERKKAEEALVEERNKFESVAKAIGAGLVIVNKNYHILWANDFIKRYKGDTIGKLCFASLNSLNSPCSDCGVAKIFAGKTLLDSHEYCSTTVDGTTYWVEIIATPITDGHGNIISAVEIAVDITERKKAEEHRKVLERKVESYSEHLKCMVDLRTAQLKDANERLVKSERLAAIGELAGMVGHDLRNPLAGISNATYFLKKKGTAISEAQNKEMFEIIDKAIDHSNKIINDLLSYSREMHLKLIKFAARPLVDEAIRMTQVPDRIQIVNDVLEDSVIWVDADKMTRVFINLINNAIDAMPEKGLIRISSRQNEDCVKIAFADTGSGIPQETLHKLFTPLFTTKVQGMGFGLAICKRITEAHEGTITVKTAINKGTIFTITLPIQPKVSMNQKLTETSNQQ